jgi:endonuclease I
MKKLVFIALLAMNLCAYAQSPEVKEYYKNVDFNTSGATLKTALGKLITETHTRKLNYTPGVWEALKVADLDPENKDQVILIYGHPGKTTGIQSRVRAKNSNGGSNGQWNREHVFAKSLGNPNLGESGPGSDAHHLRPSDVQWNSSRGNLKFANGSGNSGSVSGGWYPGDEWKGDVARMMMYMYLRYGEQCLPTRVGEGSSAGTSDAMIDLFLNWNAEDPVSELEIQRNNYLGNASNAYGQGNRNPFIDNPYLATKIWGGKVAEDKWGTLSTGKEEFVFALKVYPNPTTDSFALQSKDLIQKVEIYNLTGQLINTYNNINNNTYNVTGLAKGVYLVTAYTKNGKETRKVVVQ